MTALQFHQRDVPANSKIATQNYQNGASTQTMPTILRVGPYRLYFYSHEPNEPPHIHIDRDRDSCKFWLEPVELAKNIGFSDKEIRKLKGLVEKHQEELLKAWHEFFDS